MAESSVTEFEAYRGLLFSIAYRMLGSASDAEDLVQDAYVRFASVDGDTVRDVKAFLVTILTRLALDRLKSAQVQREQYIGSWLPEPVFTGNDADPFARALRGEAVQFALLTALEKLSPQERAVLLFSEVLDHDHNEIAEMLGITAAASRQLLHRARERVAAERKRREPSNEEKQRLLAGFLSALRDGDVDALRAVLTDDVTARADSNGKVPGAGRIPISGFEKVARLFLALTGKAGSEFRVAIEEVNGEPAVVSWTGDTLQAVITLGYDGGKIAELRTIVNPEKLAFAARQPLRN